MRSIRLLFFLAICVPFLGACQSTQKAALNPLIFADQHFQPQHTVPDRDEILRATPDMQLWVKQVVTPKISRLGIHRALFDSLNAESGMRLEYESSFTRTASQAYESKSGNCLSLVLYTAALAKQLNIPVYFQEVKTSPSWVRSQDLYVSLNHVNLALGKRNQSFFETSQRYQRFVIDFLPNEDISAQVSTDLSEATILAMYYNNRAAEILMEGDVSKAYWFSKAAIQIDPDFMGALNTLAVIHQRQNNLALSTFVFEEILRKEPSNTLALSNIIDNLSRLNRPQEAKNYQMKLASIRQTAPFHLFNQGRTAMQNGDFALAKRYFSEEVKNDPYYDEFHFWLALAHLNLGEISDAKNELNLATQNATTRKNQQLYATKLEKLKSLTKQ